MSKLRYLDIVKCKRRNAMSEDVKTQKVATGMTYRVVVVEHIGLLLIVSRGVVSVAVC